MVQRVLSFVSRYLGDLVCSLLRGFPVWWLPFTVSRLAATHLGDMAFLVAVVAFGVFEATVGRLVIRATAITTKGLGASCPCVRLRVEAIQLVRPSQNMLQIFDVPIGGFQRLC